MNEGLEDNGQFKMRVDEPVEEPVIPTTVDELKLEKLNTRVTVISILIPVLIVIVLVITYLDIKKRVVRTEDTGTISVQKLSRDLESRFSSLSVRQAELEQNLTALTEKADQAAARMEVKIKKMEDSLNGIRNELVGRKQLDASVEALDKKIGNIARSIEEIRIQVASLPQDVEGRFGRMQDELSGLREQLESNQTQMEKFENRITDLDQQKIDKPAMDLAMRLEALKIEQNFKARMDALESKLKNMAKQLKEATRSTSTSAPSPSTASQPAPSQTKPSPGAPPSSEGIQEQTIPR